jgi:micrococcal nuclease
MKKIFSLIWAIVWYIFHPSFEATLAPGQHGDGDSFKVTKTKNGKVYMIRLSKFDAPEYTQQGGKEATKATRALLTNTTFKVSPIKKGHYGRTIGNVILQNGENLATTLIQKGMGWDTSNRFFKRHRKAKRAKIGIWAYKKNQDPKKFRQLKTA